MRPMEALGTQSYQDTDTTAVSPLEQWTRQASLDILVAGFSLFVGRLGNRNRYKSNSTRGARYCNSEGEVDKVPSSKMVEGELC